MMRRMSHDNDNDDDDDHDGDNDSYNDDHDNDDGGDDDDDDDGDDDRCNDWWSDPDERFEPVRCPMPSRMTTLAARFERMTTTAPR